MTVDHRTLLRDALQEIRGLRERLAASEGAQSEPIAIVGASGRFPGGAEDIVGYWSLLRDGGDAIVEVPPDRWDLAAYYDPQGGPGRVSCRWGGYLTGDVYGFDPAFFGISPREAAAIDPQQRLLLEVAYEALEDAGWPPARAAGSRTGVFVGIFGADYFWLHAREPALLDAQVSLGNGDSVAAGRIAYAFDLRGPCMAIDTVCSSSLVALHLACQSLRSRECDLALAGGVNLMLAPLSSVLTSQLQALAPDGRCKTFDARADGFVRGEGCGVVALRRLADARAAGDPIWAVIRGTAVGQDGRSAGLTAPSGLAQEAVMRAALQAAGVEPGAVGHVEAHGSGTPLGDPIELEALRAVYGRGRGTCLVGSVKTNIGHLEAAAGVAGLIKTALILRHGEVPAHLHFRALNPRVSLEGSRLEIPTQHRPWPEGQPLVAAVSSFGVTGTNAHAILEAPPRGPGSRAEARAEPGEGSAWIVPLSAGDDEALRRRASVVLEWLAEEPGQVERIEALSAAAARCEGLPVRAAAPASTTAQLQNGLVALARGEWAPGIARGRAGHAPPRVVLVFPGQGGQWPGMGLELARRERVFREALEACDAALRPFLGAPLWDVLAAPEQDSRLLTDVTAIQPALFAIEVALAAQWRAWGVEPAALVGHSMGEVAAAHVAGVLDLADAARVIGVRSQIVRQARGGGGMIVVDLPEHEAAAALGEEAAWVAVGAINGPRSTVLSGQHAALGRVRERLERAGALVRTIKVDYASHSPQMDPLLATLERELAGLRPGPAALPLRSTVTLTDVDGAALDGAYWARNLRAPVRLWEAVAGLAGEGCSVFLELSPHSVLAPVLATGAATLDRPFAVVPVMRREDEVAATCEALGSLYCAGARLAWEALAPAVPTEPLDLPPYPWTRDSLRTAARDGAPQAHGHPLLGQHVELAQQPGVQVWHGTLSLAQVPWLAEHRVHDELVVPGAVLAAALSQIVPTGPQGSGAKVDVVLEQPLVVPEEGSLEVQWTATPQAEGRWALACAVRAEGLPWQVHARGTAVAEPARARQVELAALRQRCLQRIDGETHVQTRLARGMEFGPQFSRVEAIWRGSGEALVELHPEELPGGSSWRLHPVVLDAALQAIGAAAEGVDGPPGLPYVPVALVGLEVLAATPAPRWAHLVLRPAGADTLAAAVTLLGDDGTVLASLDECVCRRLDPGALGRAVSDAWLFEVEWEEQPRPADVGAAGRWLVVGGPPAFARALGSALTARGGEVERIEMDDESALDRLEAQAEDLRGVVVLALDAQEIPEGLRAAGTALRSAQALVRGEGSARLWWVTAGAWADAPWQALVHGLARTVELEHPELRCTVVELDAPVDADRAAVLASELTTESPEREVMLAAQKRQVPRLVRYARTSELAPPGGAWLLAGGLGGLGLAVAQGLVEAGVRHLALLGRRPPSPAAQATIEALRSAGAQVEVVRADLGDAAALGDALGAVEHRLPPIHGVIHCAAQLDDAVILRLDPSRLATVARAKVDGAWNLHRRTMEWPLEHFVMFSSAAEILGSPGQGHYAAANAFLGALARYRRAQGLPALSIAWGPWAEVGLAAQRAEEFRGFGPIAPAEGVHALLHVLGEPRAELAVMPFDAASYRAGLPVDSPKLDRLPRAAEPRAAGGLRAAVDAAPAAERGRVLERGVRRLIAQVLRLPAERIGREDPIAALGMDSLMALELRNRLEQVLALRLPGTLMWRHGTLEQLVGFLGAELAQAGDAEAGVDAADPGPEGFDLAEAIAAAAALSDQEVRRRIQSRGIQSRGIQSRGIQARGGQAGSRDDA